MPLRQSLVDALNQILGEQRAALSEYQLIKLLQQPPYAVFDPEALRDPLTLFQSHFVLFHHLYLLQGAWLSQGKGQLEIGVGNIQLHPYPTQPLAKLVAKADPLRDYYLDWQNFDNTHKQDVEALLDNFWQAMGEPVVAVSAEEQSRAMDLFGITEPVEDTELKKRYRQLQHQFHPDKGGSVAQCQQIDWAYSVLKRWLNH